MKVKLRVVPSSSRDQIMGFMQDALKVKVTAPPEKGKANVAVIQLLAKELGVATQSITLVNGHGSSDKLVDIDGLGTSALDRFRS
jgi:uncharacterized protein